MCCWRRAIKHAREGYAVTRSQARLTVEKYCRAERPRRASCKPFLSTASRRRRARGSSRASSPTRSNISPSRARRFLSRRRRPRDRRRSGAHRQSGDARRSGEIRATVAEPLSVCASQAGTLYNSPPPTQGLASLIILGAVRSPARQQGRKLRAHPRPGRSDQARLPRARPRRHRSRPDRRQSQPFSRAELSRRRGGQDRHEESRALAGAERRGRHRLDGRGGRLRPRRLLHPVALLGVRLRLSCCRQPAS